nr:PREDICTED: myomegalin-like [Lepisosteus oculatus]
MSNGYRTLSQHLNDLKKENFSLKLRIYFLEERIQQKYEDSSEDVYRRNIELKVEVESLKQELQEKQQLLDTALTTAESLTNQNEAELQRRCEERQQEIDHMQEILETKIQLLQEEAKLARNEAEKMASHAEAETLRCFTLEKRLKESSEGSASLTSLRHQQALAEKDRIIDELTQELRCKVAAITELSDEKTLLSEKVEALEDQVHDLTSSLQQKERDAEFFQDELGREKLRIQQEMQGAPMLDSRMKDACRICARELCGNQRRWIFHTASKLNLQVLLSHVLGRELTRDGKREFACSKCAFMLDRVYRFDTVIARIEALSIERLQRLLQEKERLRQCIGSLYRRTNGDEAGPEGKAGDGTVDISGLPDLRYSALLQEDFAYSGYESWAELEEQTADPHHHCHASEISVHRSRRCRGCAALRVADSDYEAVCKVPRKLARSISCGPSTRYSASVVSSVCGEEPAAVATVPESVGETSGEDADVSERMSPGSSVESLDTAVEMGQPAAKDEEAEREMREDQKFDSWPEEAPQQLNMAAQANRLDLALSLVKNVEYRPIQSPRGSKLPVLVKSVPPGPNSKMAFADLTLRTPYGTGSEFPAKFQEMVPPRIQQDMHLELSELEELWQDVYEEYMPFSFQNLIEEQQSQLNQYECAAGQCVTELQKAQLQVQSLQIKIHDTEATNKKLQEKLREMESELRAIKQAAQKQERTIQGLSETVTSKDTEAEELYRVIEGQNDTLCKLRDMAHRNQLQQVQVSQEELGPAQLPPLQAELLNLQNSLFSTQLELQSSQRAHRHSERRASDLARSRDRLQSDLQEALQHREATEQHNQELRSALQQARTELQARDRLLKEKEAEKQMEIEAREKTIQQLQVSLQEKEQLIQEYVEHLDYQQDSGESRDALLDKLRERIKDRDRALERAIDEKFRCLEEKESEVRRLQLTLREKERDLERLRCILSNNEETITSLDGMLRVKALELEQVSLSGKNLQWLKQEAEDKHSQSLRERDAIISQLQTSLHSRTKEAEELTAALLDRVSVGGSQLAEELRLRLQLKERLLQEALADRGRQASEHDREVQELLDTVSTRDQQNRETVGQLSRVIGERAAELQELRRQLHAREREVSELAREREQHGGGPRNEIGRLKSLLQEKDAFIEELMQCGPHGHDEPMITSKPGETVPDCGEEGRGEDASGLQMDMQAMQDDLQLVLRKEQEAQQELSSLQSVLTKQREEIQIQAANIESLTRSLQIKDGLIKDLHSRLVEPSGLPVAEQRTQELQEVRGPINLLEAQDKVSIDHQDVLGQLVLEYKKLNEALKAEKELYHSLAQLHTHGDSSEKSQALQGELDTIQALRGQLEEALARTRDGALRLERAAMTQPDFGEVSAEEDEDDDDEDGSSEFTDSIEEDENSKLTALTMATKEIYSHFFPEVFADPLTRLVPCTEYEDLDVHGAAYGLAPQPLLSSLKAWPADAGELGKCDDVAALQQHIQDLRAQLRRSEKLIRNLQRRARSFSTTSDYASSLERPRKVNWNFQAAAASPTPSGAEEDEGWQSDGVAGVPAPRPNKELQELVARVASLEAQLKSSRMEGKASSEDLKSATWPGKYDSLIQAQARELSHLRQKMRVGRGVCHILSQHLGDTTKSFEELLRANDIDYYMGQSFREQLAQSLALAERVNSNLSDPGWLTEGVGRKKEAGVKLRREERQIPEEEAACGPEPPGPVAGEGELGLAQGKRCAPAMHYREGQGKRRCTRPQSLDLGALLSQDTDSASSSQPTQLSPGHFWEHVEVSLREQSEKLRSDLALSLQDNRELQERLMVSEATVQAQAEQLKEYRVLLLPAPRPNKELQELVARVASLEAQLKSSRMEGKASSEDLKSATWPGKYDSLIQAQARELSHLRQKMRVGRGVCHILSQHLGDTTKSFEELLRANDIDYYMGQSFREQLAQSLALAERVNSNLSDRDRPEVDDKTGHELLALRLSKELQQKDKIIDSLRSKLQQRSDTPSSSHALSETTDQSDRTSFVSDDHASTNEELELCSDMDAASEYTQEEATGRGSPGQAITDPHSHSGTPPQHPSVQSSTTASHGAQSSNNNPIIPCTQHKPMDLNQAQTGLYSSPLSSAAPFPQPHYCPDPSGPPGSLPFDPQPLILGPSYHGGAPFSLAEVHQELQMLQRQLGESYAVPHIKPMASFPLASHSQPESSSFAPLTRHAFHQSLLGCPANANGALKTQAGLLDAGAMWDMSHLARPGRASNYGDVSSGSSGYQSGTGHTGADLIEEHLGEIRSLQQRLEDSICTNNRLRQQLEERLATAGRDSGPPTNIYIQGLESVSQLSNENRALREENLGLQARLNQASRESSAEMEELREAVLAGRARLKEAELEAEQWREESRQLQAQSCEQQQEIQQLRQEKQASQERNNGLQHEVNLQQQQLDDSRQLLHSLQCELQVYDRVCRAGQSPHSAYRGGAATALELNELLAEVRGLRVQLEHSIQENSCLREQLEQQLGRSLATHRAPRPSSISITTPRDTGCKRQLFQDPVPSPPVRDTGMFNPGSPFTLFSKSTDLDDPDVTGSGVDILQPNTVLEGEAPDGSFANKNGRHAIGHVDDFSALQQQILEGKMLVHKMEAVLQSSLSAAVNTGQSLDCSSVKTLLSNTKTLRQILDEAASLLKMFWRAALPSGESCAQHIKKEQSMTEEIQKLQRKITEQEGLLQSTIERLKNTNRTKESMEHFIVSQLSRTRDVLKKARTNLEKNEYQISSLSSYSPCAGKAAIPRCPREPSSDWGFLSSRKQEPARKRTSHRPTKTRNAQCLLQVVTY